MHQEGQCVLLRARLQGTHSAPCGIPAKKRPCDHQRHARPEAGVKLCVSPEGSKDARKHGSEVGGCRKHSHVSPGHAERPGCVGHADGDAAEQNAHDAVRRACSGKGIRSEPNKTEQPKDRRVNNEDQSRRIGRSAQVTAAVNARR